MVHHQLFERFVEAGVDERLPISLLSMKAVLSLLDQSMPETPFLKSSPVTRTRSRLSRFERPHSIRPLLDQDPLLLKKYHRFPENVSKPDEALIEHDLSVN